MKGVIGHIVKKDWRVQWPLLLLWWSMLAALAFLPRWLFGQALDADLRDLTDSDNLMFGDWNIVLGGGKLLFGASLVVLLALVTDVLQADTPLGERAFWRTRPITGTQMFAAKVVFCGIFCVFIPGLIAVAGLAACGFSTNWQTAFADAALVNAGVVILAMAMAALCRRVLFGYLALAPALYLGFILLAPVSSNIPVQPLATLVYSATVVASLVALATGLAAAWWMYAYQRLRQGAALLGAGLAFALLLKTAWPLDFSARPLNAAQPITGVTIRLKSSGSLALDTLGRSWVVPLAKVTGVTMQSSDTFRPVAFRTRVGVPGNIIALAEFDERQMGGRLTLPLNLRAALSAAVGFPLGQDIPLSADWEDVPLSRLGRPQAEFLRHYQVGWNGDFYFERGRFSVRAELPLMKNAVAAGGELAGITGMATRDYHVFLNLVVLNPTGLYASLLPRDPATPAPLSIYLLVNRARREAIYLDDSSHLSALAAGSVMSTSNLFFYANLYHHPGTPQAKTFTAQETRDWLAGARLLVLGYEPVDFVSTTAILDQPAPGK